MKHSDCKNLIHLFVSVKVFQRAGWKSKLVKDEIDKCVE